jgi:DNA-binding transcriptional LysR family regulator
MRMNRAVVSELECFVAVAEELNFSRAAHRLHLSQPPLSRQIQALEAKLGARLLERSTRAVALTVAGALYLEDARQILTRLDAAAAAARRAATGECARLRLAFVGALLDEDLAGVLQAFRQRHPQCQIHLADLSPAEQLVALRDGQVDGAFIGAPPAPARRGIATLAWKSEPLLALFPATHPLAAAPTVTPAQLRDESWVMVSREAAPAFRRQIDRWCARHGARLRVVRESGRAAAVLTMVVAGQGISILPESVARLAHPGVVFRPVKGGGLTLEHTFAWRVRDPHPLIADFRQLLARPAPRPQA